MRSLLVIAVPVFALLSACGAPKVGGACDKAGFVCADKATAMECRTVGGLGKMYWTEIPCRGPGGCAKSGSDIVCDVSLDVSGDGCSSQSEGDGLCLPDQSALLTCQSGTWQTQSTCQTCTVSGGQITCQP